MTCDEIVALMGVPKEYLKKLRESNLASFRISFGLVFVHPSRNASPDPIVIAQTMYALCIHMSKLRPTHGLLLGCHAESDCLRELILGVFLFVFAFRSQARSENC